MFCGKAFHILGPIAARLLSPKVVDLQVFTKVPFGFTLAFNYAKKNTFRET